MEIEQTQITSCHSPDPQSPIKLGDTADLVFVFGARELLQNSQIIESVTATYPSAIAIGCSTAGEIYNTRVFDDTVTITAVNFEKTKVNAHCIDVTHYENSYSAGKELAAMLPPEGLTHAFVISDGLKVNGSELVRGLTEKLPDNITVTGGLSGDGGHFEETVVLWNKATVSGSATIIGFYGDQLKVGYGSLGGWDPFGTERLITRSDSNVLYELDGRSALQLYKEYLGEHADDLPAAGLLFPLAIRTPNGDTSVVRTILSVDEQQQSLTFAGDVPQGSYARLMKANFSRLVDGAMGAAQTSYVSVGGSSPELAILVSCVGRKMVLKQRIEEEVEAVREVLGENTALTGFYSYGEISPFTPGAKCELHNQTMTITTFTEH